MDQNEKMAEIRSRFSETAREYDVWIRKVVPRYDEMLDVLISCAVLNRKGVIRAIDLGCGTGALSEKLLNAHPKVELTCLDMTEDMLNIAKVRLKGHRNVGYVLRDIYDFEFDRPYDLVISSLALHHIVSDEDKKSIYRKIYGGLCEGGSFFNADHVLSSDEGLQELYTERWVEFMLRNFPKEQVENDILRRHFQEDRPARLTDHLRWLKETGFTGVDVVWKYYDCAVYCGRKV